MAPPPKDKAEVDARNRLMSYDVGWRHGATGRAKSEIYATDSTSNALASEYERGYVEGSRAHGQAYRRRAMRLGVDIRLDVLR